jgi:undecaprenyl-diphosphatase
MNLIWGINNYVAVYLNNFVIYNHLGNTIWLLSDAPIFFLPVFLLWARLYWTFRIKDKNKKENILFIFYSVVVWLILNTFIKLFIFEHRPEWIITPILQHVPDNSFPSDHATVSFSFLFALYAAWYKKTFWIFMPFVVLMNFSRIAWWIHWFFDIIVWLILWIIAVTVVFKSTENKCIIKLNKFILKIMSFIKL